MPARRSVSFEPPAKFFVNQRPGLDVRPISTTCCGRCSSRPSRTATTAARRVVSNGTGWVERIVVDRPEVSTFFTPLSICLNIDSFEHLEFETRPDQLIVYTLVQGDERIVVEFAPVGRVIADEPEQQRFAFPHRPTTSRWSSARSRRPRRRTAARQPAPSNKEGSLRSPGRCWFRWPRLRAKRSAPGVCHR